MLKLGKYITLFLISTILLLFFSSNIFATSVNTNVINTNYVDSESSNFQNNSRDNVTNPISALDTNTVANVESLDRIDYSTSSFDFTNIINVLLIAVGLVIILLAIAILIRLKR